MNKNIKKAIAASYIVPALEYVQCHQLLDTQALLDRLQIKSSQLDSNRYFLTASQYIDFMTAILEVVDEQDLIQALSSHHNLSQHGLIGLLSLCSVSIRQVINMLIRFYKLRSRLVTIEFIEDNEQAIIRISPNYDLGRAQDFTIEIGLITMFEGKQQILRSQNPTDTIEVSHAAPEKMNEHFLGSRVRYNQPYNQLVFPSIELDAKLQSTHKPTFDLLQQQAQNLLHDDDDDDTHLKVRQLIKASDDHFPTLTEVADKLAMSQRTLSRHLKASGKSYQVILDEERIARAKQLLLDSDLSITEIAMYLHFTDASHLTKLFKQQVKMTPSKYRQRHRPS